jgi:serine/threonine protein kinase
MSAAPTSPKATDSWPKSTDGYEWKGTLTQSGDSWLCLAHCASRSEDCVILVKKVSDSDDALTGSFVDSAMKLSGLSNDLLLLPCTAFQHRDEVWVVYPRVNGGPLSELLKSHYHSGIEDVSLVARLLLDVVTALEYLHAQQLVHRNIRSDSFHLDKDTGSIRLWEFQDLKEIKYKDALRRQNTMVPASRLAWTDPLILMGHHASWFKGDAYSVGMSAIELAFGAPPPSKPALFTPETVAKLSEGVSASTAFPDRPNPFGDDFDDFVIQCTISPDSRASLSDLRSHPFLKKACDVTHVQKTLGMVCKSIESRIKDTLSAPASFHGSASAMSRADSLKKPISSGWDFTTSTTPTPDDLDEDLDEDVEDVDELDDASTAKDASDSGDADSKEDDGKGGGGGDAKGHHSRPSLDADSTSTSTSAVTPLGSDLTVDEVGGELSDSDTGSSSKGAKHKTIGRFAVESKVEHSVSSDRGGRGSLSLSEERHREADVGTGGRGSLSLVVTGVDDAKTIPHIRQQSDSMSISTGTTPAGQVGRFEVHRVRQISEGDVFSPSREHSVSEARSDDESPRTVGRFFVEKVDKGDKTEASPEEWSTEKCIEWLVSLGDAYAEYAESFRENGIDGSMLLELDNDMLTELGITKKVHQMKVMRSRDSLFTGPEKEAEA